MTHDAQRRRRGVDRALEPARCRPAEHQLRRREHVGQGRGDRSGHRPAGRAAVGEGFRRRPRHAHPATGSPCSGSTGCGRWSTSIRASSAKTRWSPRSTTAPTARVARRRRSTPRCTGSSTPPHVDHLHPDAGIALATAADGEALTKECFGDRVVWMPWRRPGFQLGLDIAEVARTHPKAIGVILGGHGITAWGAHERRVRSQLARDHPHRPVVPRHPRRGPSRSAPSSPATKPLPPAERRARAAALAPLIRGLVSTDRPQVGHFTDSDVVLDF